MKGNKEVKISYWAAHLTTIVSVTMVLVIVGIIALISIGASNETRRLKEQLEVSVIMADSISVDRAELLCVVISRSPYASNARVISKEQALKNWTEETGENLEELFGVNPLSPEISFNVKADYSSDTELKKIEKSLKAQQGVEDVAMPDSEMVEAMNGNIRSLSWILGGIAVVMVIISFVLINNTVHLSVYSRRFTIHTMQLVGASNSFIRNPFIYNNMLSGLVAGIAASGLLAGALALAPGAGFEGIVTSVGWPVFGIVAAGITVVGVVICALAAALATTRYLSKDYGELFK